jgi:hypothetical protein
VVSVKNTSGPILGFLDRSRYFFFHVAPQLNRLSPASHELISKQPLITSIQKKSPGYDLITGHILKELPISGTKYHTQLFNAILLLNYFPTQRKVAQIILILKLGKPPHDLSSYLPINLLPIVSKLFEKLFLKRLLPLIEHNTLIPPHQFGSTIEQTHRIVHRINEAFEHKAYCSAAFLDISQAFEQSLAYRTSVQVKAVTPSQLFPSSPITFAHQAFFRQNYNLSPFHAGVPRGSVPGPLLYFVCTADHPTSPPTTSATFADDTVALSKDSDPAVASQKIQTHFLAIQTWLQKWRMQANALKSVHVTFTTRSGTCPPVHMNNAQLPCEDHVKYLGLHLDRKLAWTKITALIKQQTTSVQTHPQTDQTYGIQLWGTASISNIEILERFQSKALRMIVDAPWYVPNTLIQRDLQIPSVKGEISHHSSHYSARPLHNRTTSSYPSLSHQNASAFDATCQTICQLELWCNLCNYNLVCKL